MFTAVPMSIKRANMVVSTSHRHHGTVRGGLFAVGASSGEQFVGALIVGRPVARMLQDGRTAEVTRLCTDGTPNACSYLLGTAKRVCKLLGYSRLITYTLATEDGASCKASGFIPVARVTAQDWSRLSRVRVAKAPASDKTRWEVLL